MRFTLILLLCCVALSPAWCQKLNGFTFDAYTDSLDNQQIDGHTIGGLSGITYNKKTGRFLAITDNSNTKNNQSRQANIYSFLILRDKDNGLTIDDLQVTPLQGELAYTNPESIRIYDNGYIIADEAISTTRLLKASKDGKLLEEIHQMSGIRHNSGFEGTCISEDQRHVYFSMERPEELIASRGAAEDNLGVLNLYRYNFLTKEIDGQYLYPLHLPPDNADLTADQTNSFLKDNGVTEILFYDDSTLLLLERAFLGPGKKKLHIRIYKATISDDYNIAAGNFNLLEPELLFNFYDEDLPCDIDNIEGMTFGPGKKQLFLIADDNFDHYGAQTTQIISLNVK